MSRKFSRGKWLIVLLISVFLISCTSNPSVTGTLAQADDGAEAAAAGGGQTAGGASANEFVTYDADDLYSDWTADAALNHIELQGTTAAFEGTGAAISGNDVMILFPGTYVISGQLDDGQIIVDSQRDGTVRLVLNGAEIHNSSSSAIYVMNADKTVITLAEGTNNVVSDGESYVYATPEEDEPNAAIFSKDDLTINGTGSLTVHANYNNGIMSKDDLKITGGQITVYSVDDGLVGRDIMAVKEGTITIEAEGDGIKSTNDTDSSKGNIVLADGTFDIQAGSDGIQSVNSVIITGGQYTITSGGGSANGVAQTSGFSQGGFRGNTQGNTAATGASTDTPSTKGIKAAVDISIAGGAFNIDSADDAIHSNDSLTITKGDISISSGDDGIHADSSILIEDGTIAIAKSYEGIESKLITIAGGEIHITASDDGINISGGNDGSSVNGRPGQNSFSSSGDNKLVITGGTVVVNASGDGLDANGSISMSGGTVLVNGPTNSGNGALDYDGSFEITGGIMMAAGSSGMAQAPSEQSAQLSIMMSFSTVQQAGTLVTLKDSDGKIIAAFAPATQYQSIVITAPELNKDAAYTLYSGGTSTGTETSGLYTDGELEGGTEVVSFTLSSTVTYLSESGVSTGRGSNMGGGRMGGGGVGRQ